MEATRRAIERRYDMVCDIVEYRAYEKENGATGHREVRVLEGAACRVSYGGGGGRAAGDMALGLRAVIKLFLAPEIEVKAGSKIIVTGRGEERAYVRSGVPMVYDTHQEIELEGFEKWA